MRNPGAIVTLSLLLAGPADVRAAEPAAEAEQADNPFLELSFDELLDIALIGKGEARQVQTISRDDTRLLLPGTSPFKALEKLPGVHFVAADAWGNYEWSMRLSIRGFRQSQLGYTLDGVPLGDMDYGNNNGLHVSRALIAENLERIELAQGSGAVSTASTSNLGGTLRFTSRDPAAERALHVANTYGSSDGRRSYLRWDSGETRGFATTLSLLDADTGKWKGDGRQQHRQFNGKAVYQFGEHRLWGFLNTSRRLETDYMDLSLDSQRRLGWDWDYYAPDWQRAVDAANGSLRGDVTSLDDAYFRGRGLRDDELAGVGGEFALPGGLQLRLGLYGHRNEGQGHWHTPYAPSSPAVPISVRTTEYYIDRRGITAHLEKRIGRHQLQAGIWYEDNHHEIQRNFYFIDGPEATDFFLRNPDRRVYQQSFDAGTLQVYLRDRIDLLDERLQLDLGLRSLRVDNRARVVLGGSSRAGGRLLAKDSLLPQLGARYRIGAQGDWEAFASYSENLATFNIGRDGPFSASQAAFDDTRELLRPESSRTIETGLRYSSETLVASVALYQVRFDDRLLNVAQGTPILGFANSFANVGTVDTRGVELTARWQATPALSWLNTLSFNDSTYADNYFDGEDEIATAGKQVVDTPRRLFASELSWRQGAWEARLAAKFTDARYYTYLNDGRVPSFWLLDAGLAWQAPAPRWAQSLRVQVNATNLLDRRYFATVNSNGFVASDPDGQWYSLLAGAPRQAFLSVALEF